MYCIKNLVVVDHFGLFIYVEAEFPGAYHDINELWRSDLAANWRDFLLTAMSILSTFLATLTIKV